MRSARFLLMPLLLVLWGCATRPLPTLPSDVTFNGNGPQWSWTGSWDQNGNRDDSIDIVQTGNHISCKEGTGKSVSCRGEAYGRFATVRTFFLGLPGFSFQMVMSDDGMYAKVDSGSRVLKRITPPKRLDAQTGGAATVQTATAPSAFDSALQAQVSAAMNGCNAKDTRGCALLNQLQSQCANHCNLASQHQLNASMASITNPKPSAADAINRFGQLAGQISEQDECDKCRFALANATPTQGKVVSQATQQAAQPSVPHPTSVSPPVRAAQVSSLSAAASSSAATAAPQAPRNPNPQTVTTQVVTPQRAVTSTTGNNAAAASSTMTNADVVAMVNARISPDTIILAIQKSTAAFDLSAQALVDLKKRGVPDQVLAAMLNARPESSRQLPTTSGIGLAARLGGVTVETQTLTPALRQKYKMLKCNPSSGCKTSSAVIVSEVAIDSAAAQAGLRSGDMVWGIANGDGVAPTETKEEFLRAARLCAPDCLIFLFHPDGDMRSKFLMVGPIENSFLPLYRPNTTTIIGYKSMRAPIVYDLVFGATDDETTKWLWNQAFGDDDKHPRPGAVVTTFQSGRFLTVTGSGYNPVLHLDASNVNDQR